MDISVYPTIKQGLKDHLESLEYVNSFRKRKKYDFVVGFAPSEPTYPYVKIQEPRNVPVDGFRGKLEKISNLGYKVDIYAKTIKPESKQDIARNIMKLCNDYLTCIGLKLVSYNEVENDGLEGDLYHIILMFNANYWENRGNIL